MWTESTSEAQHIAGSQASDSTAESPLLAGADVLREGPGDETPSRQVAAQELELDPGAADESLLAVARQRPEAAARFLKAVLLAGGLLPIFLAVPCAAFFLSGEWQACGTCSRPLHVWVLVNCALHLLQSPLRFALLRRLWLCAADTDRLPNHIWALTLSCVWRTSTWLSTASYAWLIIGIVWLLNANFCTPCPKLYLLSWGVMIVAIAKPIVTLAAFRHTFGSLLQSSQVEGPEQQVPPRGACKRTIASLPLVEYDLALQAGAQTSCAVCLSDFEDRELLRKLPCGHKFHKPCIDEWLRRNKVCPLCMQDVETPSPPPPPGQCCSHLRRA